MENKNISHREGGGRGEGCNKSVEKL